VKERFSVLVPQEHGQEEETQQTQKGIKGYIRKEQDDAESITKTVLGFL